jgi:hypothetical protein
MFLQKYTPSLVKINYQDLDKLDFRNEKKLIFYQSENYLLNLLRFLEFKEIYEKRKINSIYLDTFDLNDFKDTVDGEKQRSKLRMRWYGQTFNSTIKPILENKIKINNKNFKIKQNLKNLQILNDLSYNKIKKYLNDSEVQDPNILVKFQRRNPNIFISYDRRYYMFKNIRITMDSNLHYRDFYKNNKISKNDFIKKKNFHILEMKYDDDQFNNVTILTNKFRNRVTKFSKYEYSLMNI